MKRTIAIKTINEYLALQPEPIRESLEKLRDIIKSLVPDAIEVISYQIPTFKYHGSLVGFAAFKNHCSFFVMNSTLIALLKEDLKAFDTTPSSIHFQVDKPLPTSLVKKIVKIRIKENEARAKAKQK